MKKVKQENTKRVKKSYSWKKVKQGFDVLLVKCKEFWLKGKKLVSKYIKIIIAKTIKVLQYIQYEISITAFLFPKKVAYYIMGWLRKFGLKFFTTLFFITLTVFVFVLGMKVNLSLGIEVARDFLIGSAAMVGGSLAIVTTFALFTIQNAAENLPKSFYKVATDIKKYLWMFLVNAAVAMTLFVFSITYGRTNLGLSATSVQLAIFGIGTSFYILFILLYNLKDDIDPDKLLIKVNKELSSLIEEVAQKTREYARILLLHPKNRNIASVESLVAQLYQSPANQQQFTYLNNHIAYLFDYHDSLLAGHQKSAAIEVLEKVQVLVMKYLNSRKKTSLAFLEENSIFVFKSDSKYILQPILERIINLSEEYMKKEDTNGIIKIVDMFISWLMTAKEIEYIGTRARENPIIGQISGYFDQLIKRVINLNSLEAMFQSLRFYLSLALIAIEKNYFHKLSSSLETIEEIGFQSIKTRQEAVITQVFEYYSLILEKLVTTDFILNMTISMIMKHVDTLTLYGYIMTIRGSLRDNMIAQQDLAKPYNKLQQMIFWTADKARRATVGRERDGLQRDILELAEELRNSLRDLSEKFKNPNHFIVISFGEIIENIGALLIELSEDPIWSTYSAALLNEARVYIHLPTWFLNETKKVDNDQSLEALTEAITSMGVVALEKGKDDIAEEAIKILPKMALDILAKETGKGALYVEPEIMEKACYIGILALKKSKTAMVGLLKASITEFDNKYAIRYFSNPPAGIDVNTLRPSPQELKNSIVELENTRRRSDLNGMGLGDNREKVLKLVTVKDIANFITTIWG